MQFNENMCVQTADLSLFGSCGAGWDSDKCCGCRTLINTLFINLVLYTHSADEAAVWTCGCLRLRSVWWMPTELQLYGFLYIFVFLKGTNVGQTGCASCAPTVLLPGPPDTTHIEFWHRFSWCTVISLFLTSQLNHHSPYCAESTQEGIPKS